MQNPTTLSLQRHTTFSPSPPSPFPWRRGVIGTMTLLISVLCSSPVAQAEEIFSDGFESGDVSHWESCQGQTSYKAVGAGNILPPLQEYSFILVFESATIELPHQELCPRDVTVEVWDVATVRATLPDCGIVTPNGIRLPGAYLTTGSYRFIYSRPFSTVPGRWLQVSGPAMSLDATAPTCSNAPTPP